MHPQFDGLAGYMVVGFNHNFLYKNEMFHVQTEDGGLKSPNIITLLYRGGTILASKKTSYADITKVNQLDQVVEALMKEQHKEMLRRLKDGEFDEVIEQRRPVSPPPVQALAAAAAVAAPAPVLPPPSPSVPIPVAVKKAPVAVVKPATEPTTDPAAEPLSDPVTEPGLDDIILSYLVGDDN
jgi:hypothetical protein